MPRLPTLLSALCLTGCLAPITDVEPGAPGSAQVMSAGEAQACSIQVNGRLKCWGKEGLVGDGTRALRPTPVDVRGLAEGVLSVVTGERHSCALTRNDRVSCWGTGTDRGQLGPAEPHGDQPLLESLEPRSIDLGTSGGPTAIAGGARHTCAIEPLGEVWCWGDNAQWQLSAGAAAISPSPAAVQDDSGEPILGVRLVAAGGAHSCIVTGVGDAQCWGSNEHGQLALGTADLLATTPQPVSLGAPVTAIAAGQSHTCALLVGGAVRCWGSNASGQLGNDTGVDSASPVSPALEPGHKVLALAAGGDVTCAITEDQTLRCWGDNTYGQIGDGTQLPRYAPQPIRELAHRVRSVTVGATSACAVTLAGKAYCWGRNDQGQLGDGTTTDRSSPVEVKGL